MKLIITNSIPTQNFKRSGIFGFDDYKYFQAKGESVKMIILYRITYERKYLFKIKTQIREIQQQVNEIKDYVSDNPDIEFIPYFSLIKPFVFKEDLFLFKKSKFYNILFDQVRVHSMLHTGLNINWIKKQFPNSTIILKEHTNWLLYSSVVRYFALMKLNQYDLILANSKFSKETFVKILKKNKMNIINKIKVDYPKFHINTQIINKSNSTVLEILTIANLIKEKGFEEAFGLLKILDDHNIRWKWTIIGKGMFYDNIMNISKELGYTERIDIFEEVQKPELFYFLKKSNLYLQLSYKETFGIAPIEAFSYCNKLIVSDNITSIKELELDKNSDVLIIKDLNGIQIQTNEIIQFVSNINCNNFSQRLLNQINNEINNVCV